MPLRDVELPRNYRNGQVLFAEDLTVFLDTIEDAFTTVNQNLTQLSRDSFSSGHTFDNDGLQNISPSLQDQINLITSGGTPITGTTSNTFTINSDAFASVLDTASLTATRTHTLPNFAGTLMAGGCNNAGTIGIPATQRIYLDGVAMTGDTYIYESSANVVDVITGTQAIRFSATEVSIPATNRLSLDGGGDTYLTENAANEVSLVVGGVTQINQTTTLTSFFQPVTIPATDRIFFDGGGDTSIRESAADTFQLEVGGVDQITQTTTLTTFAQPILLPAEDPPVANQANRNGIVKAWGIGSVDAAGTGCVLSASYNVSSVSAAASVATINWNTNFTGDYTVVVGSSCGAANVGDYTAELRATADGSCDIIAGDNAGGQFLGSVWSFTFVAYGTQV